MKLQKHMRHLSIWSALLASLSWAPASVAQPEPKNTTGSIQWRSSSMLVIPCTPKDAAESVQLWSDTPVSENGEKNPKAKSTELSCKDMEPIDANNSIVYIKDGAKANSQGFITAYYQNKGKWAEGLILEKNFDRYESLCEYAFKKNNLKQAIDGIVGQEEFENYEIQKAQAEQHLKEYFSHGAGCSARNLGFHEPLLQSKKCIYDNSRILNAPSSGRCITRHLNKARAKGVDELFDEYLKTFGATALAFEKHGIPAELFLAKVRFETGNGTSTMLSQNNNIGGIGNGCKGDFSTEVIDLSGKKRTIKIGCRDQHFKFNSMKDSLDYYGFMMLYHRENRAYEDLRKAVCSNTNLNVDLDKSETISPHKAADTLIRYSERGIAYVNELKSSYINSDSIRTFKEKYMLCEGEDEAQEKFFESCAKGEMKEKEDEPVFDDNKKGEFYYDPAFDKNKKDI